MNNLVKTVGVAVVAGAVALAGVAPAAAAPWWGHHRYYRHAAPIYPGFGYYPGYYPYYNPGAEIGSAIVGGIVGTIAGAAISGGGGHFWRCEHNYRSYERGSNSYMGFDGARHLCRL